MIGFFGKEQKSVIMKEDEKYRVGQMFGIGENTRVKKFLLDGKILIISINMNIRYMKLTFKPF